jgi:hypothetical protein
VRSTEGIFILYIIGIGGKGMLKSKMVESKVERLGELRELNVKWDKLRMGRWKKLESDTFSSYKHNENKKMVEDYLELHKDNLEFIGAVNTLKCRKLLRNEQLNYKEVQYLGWKYIDGEDDLGVKRRYFLGEELMYDE